MHNKFSKNKAVALKAWLPPLVCASAVIGLIAPRGFAACPLGWRTSQPIAAIDGPVFCMTEWDPDGNGPLPPLLVVGGEFTHAGNVSANNVAAWNGVSWQAMGGGLITNVVGVSGGARVISLVNFNGELVAGGTFDLRPSGPTPIYQWTAKWNGTSWASKGQLPNSANVLSVVNNKLYAGFSTGIMVWNNGWGFMPGGGTTTGGPVIAIGAYNGFLIAGGTFSTIGGASVHNIAYYDGAAWQEMNGGVSGGIPQPRVYALGNFNGELVVGGEFTVAGGVAVAGIAAWNAFAWHGLNGGVQGEVNTLCTYNNQLFVGGGFSHADGLPTNGVAAWNGTSWDNLAGSHGNGAYQLIVHNGDLVEGAWYSTGDMGTVERWGPICPTRPTGVQMQTLPD